MRVVKEAEERKNEILDAAERLVRQKEIPVLQRLTLAIRAVQVDDRWGDALMEQGSMIEAVLPLFSDSAP